MRPVPRASGRIRWRFVLLNGLAGAGLVITAWLIISGWERAGRDALAYWHGGQAFLAGEPVYGVLEGEADAFVYPPPLLFVFAAASILPFEAWKALLLGVNVACLRYLTGSWPIAGLVLLYPFAWNELYVGNVNLIVGASLLAAARGQLWPLVATGMAKVAPLLLVPQLVRERGSPRPALVIAAVMGAWALMTLPWLSLWGDWLAVLTASSQVPEGSVAIPFFPRLAVALVLVAAGWLRRDWVIALLAPMVAMPVIWPSTPLIGLAAWRWWRDRAGEVQPLPAPRLAPERMPL